MQEHNYHSLCHVFQMNFKDLDKTKFSYKHAWKSGKDIKLVSMDVLSGHNRQPQWSKQTRRREVDMDVKIMSDSVKQSENQ